MDMKIISLVSILLIGTDADIVPLRIPLNTGRECPIIGLGTGPMSQNDTVKQMVNDAVEFGYRHIDTADYYGNEAEIGEAVNDVIRRGLVRRDEMFITTKIFHKEYPESDRSAKTEEACHSALAKLNLNYIDLMLIHSPSKDPNVNSEVWKGLENALYQGLIRSIGVSNFDIEQIQNILNNSRIVPAMNQIESNPRKNNRELIDFCKSKNIAVTAYSPLGRGQLTDEPKLIELGKKHNKSAAQVMIRWQIQRGVVVIPRSKTRERIRENIDVYDFYLTVEEMKFMENYESEVSKAFTLNASLFSFVSLMTITSSVIHLLFLFSSRTN